MVATNFSCLVKHVSRNLSYFQASANLIRPIDDINLHFTLYYKQTSNIYQMFLVDMEENFCDFLKRKDSNGFLLFQRGQYLMNRVRMHSNVVQCPSSINPWVNVPIYQGESLDLFAVPTGEYKIDAFCKSSNVTLGKLTVYVSVKLRANRQKLN